ncbi:extracellular solute-binding protein [Oribacterium sp. oral taxon 102]|uniref:extracellular solute-binding protein n=1 Tax=Oribacterium sp. oral taxon 102 TaxID=671214 RepID=UPI0015BD88A3|nr:extracellular solute-binding protein [Oribacterium sp. oral taxon 102]NWO21896.1 extracellular solute-binding protein [Oribacterium sp. oral taxon 102]
MRRIRVLALLLLSGALVACGHAGRRETGTVEKITLWHYYKGEQKKSLDAALKQYNEGEGRKHGIEVDAVCSGSLFDLENDISAIMENHPVSGELPNIIMCYSGLANRLDKRGMLENLAPYFTGAELERFVDSYLSEGMLSGSRKDIKILPLAKSTEVLYLNETDWERFSEETGAELGKLSTMEGIAELSELYYRWTDEKTPEPNDGKAFFGRDDIPNFLYISGKQLGIDVLSAGEGDHAAINFPRQLAERLWQSYYIPYIKGYFASGARYHSDDIKTGNVLCYVSSSAGASYFPKRVILSDTERYPIQCRVLAAPKLAGGMDFAIQQGAGMAVLKGSKAEAAAAVEFLKWLSGGTQNIRFAVNAGYLPVEKTAASEAEILAAVPEIRLTDAIQVGLETVQDNELYTTPPVQNAGRIRKGVGRILSEQAEENRRLLSERLAAGQSMEAAEAGLTGEESFERWYNTVSEKLQGLAASED